MYTVFEKNVEKYQDKLLPHHQRVIVEYNELEEKITKLEIFANSVYFRSLDSVEQGLLTSQAYCMQQYLQVLKQRIEWFIGKLSID